MSTFYRPVGSYSLSPHQRNHTSYPNHYYPNWEIASPQINGDPGRSPIMNEPWSCGGGYGYFNPAECHGCCANGYWPACYGFKPPHSHLLPSPFPHYHHGPYLPYPEVYSPYCVPPPHYSVGQPRYEYDKNLPGNHCCGCPSHQCSSKVDGNVKIEEQEPEVEKAEQKSSTPIKSGEYQKPVVWIPPGYVKEEDGSLSSKPRPQVWSGWLPFDMSNTKSLKQGGEERKTQDEQNEEDRSHFPCPIIWMPAYEKPQEAETKDLKDINSVPKSPEDTPPKQYQQNEEKREHFPFPFFWMPAYDKRPEAETKDLKEVSQGPKSAEEVPSKLKTIPVKLLRCDECGDKPIVADDTSGVNAKVAEEELKPKSIPVKQMEDFEEKKSSGGTGTSPKSIPVKQMEENANKSSHGCMKSRPGSPKASKLSPVCLRVDPLPRRKNGNGASRSPSPPGGKDKLQEEHGRTSLTSLDTVKESEDSKVQDSTMKKVSEEQAGKNDREAVEIRDKGRREDTIKSLWDVPVVSKEQMPEILVTKKVEMDEKEQKTAKEAVESKTEKWEDPRKKTKNISVTEAAVLIQSAYRGYEVRKWQPLKKLRQVGKVREQVEEVRERIHALESSPELQRDEKQKVSLGETIMGLLLQLDVIQGLHPSLRDIRKSVARDLVSLQERLDSMASQESEGSKLTLDAPTNSAKQVVENIPETNVDVGVPLGRNDEEKPLELSKAPSIALHGNDTEPNGPTNESIETEGPILEKLRTSSADDEIVVGPLTNEVLADSREQREEKALEPLLEDKERDSKIETITDVEPCLVREMIETPHKGSEEAQSEAAGMKLSIDMEEEKSTAGPEMLVENELECKPQELDELPLVVESVADQLKEAMDDVIQLSTLQELQLGVLEGTLSSDSEQNVGHVTRRKEEPETLSTDSDVGHVTVESLEFADSDSKPGSSVLQPTAKEDLTDEEHMTTPKLEDSAYILQGVERNHEEKRVEDQVITNVDSFQAVSTSPSDSTDHIIASQAEDMGVIMKESEDDISDTELPKIDGCIVKEVGKDCLPSIQLDAMEAAWGAPNVTEDKDGTDGSETVTGDEVDHKPCGSEMVEGVITSFPAEMEGEITSSDPVAQVSHEQSPKILDIVQGRQVPLHDNDLVEDNEKLKEMLQKLLLAGKEQLSIISDLNGRIKDLERKLKSKKKMKMRPRRVKQSNALAKGNAATCAA
ncbi:BAG family molecular chaperone regulator 6 [Telopea speciosissima]|uniref:BAG family molecular chaperone regulator 6 n=1 Tax=Telopea speciosissima TaxID=54955 RepID=UPI001CC3945A|nr:BAG family molecular chaperone regulator 6 [Telopea speciosissima]